LLAGSYARSLNEAQGSKSNWYAGQVVASFCALRSVFFALRWNAVPVREFALAAHEAFIESRFPEVGLRKLETLRAEIRAALL